MRVVVTDHHLPGATLPAADAIVNPNLAGDAFPSKAIAGVGVVFYLMLALRARLREVGWFGDARPEPDLAALLDLVALGTVADLVPLDANNRVLVAAGLRRMRAGRACAGVNALCRAAGRDPARIVASDLGFALAPRINAAGRLEDMRLGIECLLTDDAARRDRIWRSGCPTSMRSGATCRPRWSSRARRPSPRSSPSTAAMRFRTASCCISRIGTPASSGWSRRSSRSACTGRSSRSRRRNRAATICAVRRVRSRDFTCAMRWPKSMRVVPA